MHSAVSEKYSSVFAECSLKIVAGVSFAPIGSVPKTLLIPMLMELMLQINMDLVQQHHI